MVTNRATTSHPASLAVCIVFLDRHYFKLLLLIRSLRSNRPHPPFSCRHVRFSATQHATPSDRKLNCPLWWTIPRSQPTVLTSALAADRMYHLPTQLQLRGTGSDEGTAELRWRPVFKLKWVYQWHTSMALFLELVTLYWCHEHVTLASLTDMSSLGAWFSLAKSVRGVAIANSLTPTVYSVNHQLAKKCTQPVRPRRAVWVRGN